jgi:hypothetical protein
MLQIMRVTPAILHGMQGVLAVKLKYSTTLEACSREDCLDRIPVVALERGSEEIMGKFPMLAQLIHESAEQENAAERKFCRLRSSPTRRRIKSSKRVFRCLRPDS